MLCHDDDGGTKFLLNVRKIPQDNAASHPRDSNIQSSTHEPYIPHASRATLFKRYIQTCTAKPEQMQETFL